MINPLQEYFFDLQGKIEESKNALEQVLREKGFTNNDQVTERLNAFSSAVEDIKNSMSTAVNISEQIKQLIK